MPPLSNHVTREHTEKKALGFIGRTRPLLRSRPGHGKEADSSQEARCVGSLSLSLCLGGRHRKNRRGKGEVKS